MAMFTGKAVKVSYNGVDLGECSFQQTQPEESAEPLVTAPKAAEVTVSMTLLPGAMPVITDWLLRGRLGPNYKN